MIRWEGDCVANDSFPVETVVKGPLRTFSEIKAISTATCWLHRLKCSELGSTSLCSRLMYKGDLYPILIFQSYFRIEECEVLILQGSVVFKLKNNEERWGLLTSVSCPCLIPHFFHFYLKNLKIFKDKTNHNASHSSLLLILFLPLSALPLVLAPSHLDCFCRSLYFLSIF